MKNRVGDGRLCDTAREYITVREKRNYFFEQKELTTETQRHSLEL